MGEEKDIIDIAMANDDYDYGDKTAPIVDENADPNALTVETDKEVGEQQTITPEQSIKQIEKAPVDQNTRQPAPNTDASNPLNLKRVGAQFADGKGNIVDKDGKMIARAGEAARHWQEASRANAQVQNLTKQNETMQRQMQEAQHIIREAKEIAELPAKLGVSREDYNEGITLMSNWRKDPVAVAREIVARTLTFGYNVSDILGKSAGDALETKAIAQMVKEATAPIRQQQEQSSRTTEANEVATRNYNDFVSRYEHADMHGELIAGLMARGESPVDAYYKVRETAIRNGFDFSQPLGPQVAARRQGGQRNPAPRTAPMANGGRVDERQVTTQTDMANADDDWGSILRNAMSSNQ